MQSPITLINVFTVSLGKEDEFIRLWNETAHLMKKEPGFIDTKLHRSLDPNAEFAFINIAHWESQQNWQQAIDSNPKLQDWWAQIALISQAHPALYKVEVQY
ncbi:antibiotic biosynthesis monooxygenase [Aetokthonos hydrillicola Thurmond2011]|uniref:Antibiotic biosynthesis monooxygenase n=1 Tax=Aetokthonos hydrillicola Thurmond2011 TaxID=2712845 RepID=A0AAP5M8Q7_9CYAN|nr:antibiotic biosynthesis monooxygenase family protein [Aetokthonos hydrillicola]MBO3459400.1 antibiotic biosynthesis monooxygenase [Aetokthonos hydrillicola CCALA 1050]MBW4586546.1 antibiotic biosynthesis monooxygenase [Aetokthonos hydrillicola CCALA 1050]MDR9893509.1 antibiotic biosynthesis monooxygenase [Aetokthonos hydrillicola Thurmond2011]